MSEDDESIATSILDIAHMAFDKGKEQGRKDAIDEVLGLIKEGYKELPECFNGFEWLEGKLR